MTQNGGICVFTCRCIAEKGPLSMDNFYNSPDLVQRLQSLKTDCWNPAPQ